MDFGYLIRTVRCRCRVVGWGFSAWRTVLFWVPVMGYVCGTRARARRAGDWEHRFTVRVFVSKKDLCEAIMLNDVFMINGIHLYYNEVNTCTAAPFVASVLPLVLADAIILTRL